MLGIRTATHSFAYDKDSKSPYVEGPTLTWHWQKIKGRNYKRREKIEFHPKQTLGEFHNRPIFSALSVEVFNQH